MHCWSSTKPAKWFIRVNAIRDLLKSSKEAGFVVLINEASGKDLFVYGEAQPTTIDVFIRSLAVERNLVADQRGYSVPDSWANAIEHVKYQRHFPKGSILIEDLVRFQPEFFIAMVYSSKSKAYVIMINNAGKILVQE